MKRPGISVLAGSVVAAACCDAALSQVAVRVEPPQQTVTVGSLFQVNVKADLPAPVCGWGLDVAVANTNILQRIGPPSIVAPWTVTSAADGDDCAALAYPNPIGGTNTQLASLQLFAQTIGSTSISLAATAGDLSEGFALLTPGGFVPATFQPGQVLVIAGAPGADFCQTAIPVTAGSYQFTTVNATTDGPLLPPMCDSSGLVLGQDIWFRFVPPCNLALTVSTCNQANYDSRMAAYTGNCDNLTLVGCSDDEPGCGTTSRMVLAVTTGQPMLIRLGGWETSVGSGTLTLSQNCPPCPGDISPVGGDGQVNVNDLLAVIINWGPCPVPPAPCPANIVTSGTSANKVDVDDLLMVLLNWGPCSP